MIYRDTDQLNRILNQLFGQIAQDRQAVAKVAQARLVIRFRFSQPASEATINGRKSPPEVIFGRDSVREDLEIDLLADSFHQVMMGELPLGKAYGSKKIQVRGPIWKSFVLADLFHSGQRIYPAIWGDFQAGRIV
ncbi:MAG: hypothetical protein B6D39_02540 [Anaerolineae bacterium UTCFX2]|nr:hypothetical protein [Anaerolineales bacterium]OQY93757.1 MAG: hypothetical protein B6D39_02540 [Anaerolineae bacterium UTCFX2]